MRHGFLLGPVLALATGYAAHAQTPPGQPVNPTPSEQAPTGEQPDASAKVAGFRPGMIVKDASGSTIGPITRVGQTAEGVAAIEVDLNGRRVSLSPTVLTLSTTGDTVMSSMSKAELQAASGRSPG